MEEQTQITIYLPFLSNLFLKINGILNRFLVFFQLREKREYWGIVYDSVTKQPLDPVKVNLIYTDSGRSKDVCITDMQGRYGFLARPGKFKIFVQKTNYEFPSQIVPGENDGIYTHLYHGEFFSIDNKSEVIAPNIPMDSIAPDWNQKAKQRFVWQSFYMRWFFEKFIAVILWFGFVYVSIMSILTKLQNKYYLTFLAVYLGIFIIELSITRLRLWGVIINSDTRQPACGLKLQLTHPQTAGVVFGSAISREDGRFFLRANPGKYMLKISDKNGRDESLPIPVKIGPEGVLNQKIIIRGNY